MTDFIGSLFDTVVNGLSTIKDFFTLIFDFFKTLISFIPQPFGGITLTFLLILTIIFIYRLVRG